MKTRAGAFMKDATGAIDLARLCVELGTAEGRRTAAVVSDMSQPLGDLVGNAVEVQTEMACFCATPPPVW